MPTPSSHRASAGTGVFRRGESSMTIELAWISPSTVSGIRRPSSRPHRASARAKRVHATPGSDRGDANRCAGGDHLMTCSIAVTTHH
jgi:hypothetical protein